MRVIQHFNFGAETPPRIERKRGWAKTPKTVIIDGLPEYEALARDVARLLVGEYVEYDIQLGWSRTHPNDDFSRKEGLKLANSKINSYKASLNYASIKCGEITASLYVDPTAENAPGGLRGAITLHYVQGKRPTIQGESVTGGMAY